MGLKHAIKTPQTLVLGTKYSQLPLYLCHADLIVFVGAATDATSSGMGGKRTVFKSGDDLEDDYQEDGGSVPRVDEQSDDDVENAAGELTDEGPISAQKTSKSSNHLVKPRTQTLTKQKLGKRTPKIVKF